MIGIKSGRLVLFSKDWDKLCCCCAGPASEDEIGEVAGDCLTNVDEVDIGSPERLDAPLANQGRGLRL